MLQLKLTNEADIIGFVTLRNGINMPKLGFGTIGQSGKQITEKVAFALHRGCWLIDTANCYGNGYEYQQFFNNPDSAAVERLESLVRNV